MKEIFHDDAGKAKALWQDRQASGFAQQAVETPLQLARLGVILPSVNTVVEPWFNRTLGPDVGLHATRMLLDSILTPDALRRMDHEEGIPAAVRIASCRPHAIAYGCTASSIVQGVSYDKQLQQQLEAETGIPSFTAVGAIIDALHSLCIQKIAVASPYTAAIGEAEESFLKKRDFRCLQPLIWVLLIRLNWHHLPHVISMNWLAVLGIRMLMHC